MPYVDGADLNEILTQHGRLPIDRVLGYTRQIAAGLIAAHAAGVVHRDLKPANAIVDRDGRLYLLDFGIARSLDGPPATMAAGVVGTIDYMAPEQAQAKAVDQRADVYAFGLIVYDLLIGRRRIQSSDSAIAELMHRMQHPPVPLRLIDPSIPEPLNALVTRCIDPDPDRRFQQMTEVEAGLAQLDDTETCGRAQCPRPLATRLEPERFPVHPGSVAAAAVLMTAAALTIWWSARQRPVAPAAVTAAHEPVSLLVAQFDNRTGDAVFDGVVEQGLALGVEGASFVTVSTTT